MNRIGLTAIAWACASSALANRPLTTDTADVIEAGVSQLEVYASRATASGVPSEHGWTAQLSHGFGHRTQAGFAVSRARAGGEAASGLLLGGKTWLVALGDSGPGVTLGYGLTGIKASGDSWRRDGSYLTLIGTQPFGPSLLLHANLGWARSAIAKQNATAWAAGLEYSTEAKISLVAEAFGDDRGKPTLAVGALWQALPDFSINTSYAVLRETPRVRQWTLGVQLDF